MQNDKEKFKRKNMKVEIDQSLKIERTDKNTVVAFSNHIFASILIRAKDKREIQKIFRQAGEPKKFVYKLFAVLIFILIKDYLDKITQIIIDEEYPGKNKIITDLLMQEIIKVNPKFECSNIKFHFIAWGVAMNKKQPDQVVKLKDILKFLLK
jgi:hypothetical protein